MKTFLNQKTKKYALTLDRDLIELLYKMENWGANQLLQVEKVCHRLDLKSHAEEEFLHGKMLKAWLDKIETKPDLRERKRFRAGIIYLKKLKVEVLRSLMNVNSKEKQIYFAYIITSYLVEIRAVSVYKDLIQLYNLQEKKNRVLEKILYDEAHHLASLEEEFKRLPEEISGLWRDFLQCEERLFQKFLADFRRKAVGSS